MKKLLFVAVSFLSLSVIFGAGWAAGLRISDKGANEPTLMSREILIDEVAVPEENCGEGSEDEKHCPDCPKDVEKPKFKHGFRLKIPFPRVHRDDILREPQN